MAAGTGSTHSGGGLLESGRNGQGVCDLHDEYDSTRIEENTIERDERQ